MLLVVVILAFMFGVAMVVGLYFGGTQLPAMLLQRKLDARIDEVSHTIEEDKGPEAKVKALFKSRKAGPLPALDRRRIRGQVTVQQRRRNILRWPTPGPAGRDRRRGCPRRSRGPKSEDRSPGDP